MAAELHVLFGSGPVGQPLARILLERGKRVRIVKRSAGALPAGAELLRGDATDLNFCVEAVRGASTVYHCMNPPYYARVWAELLPRYMDNLIAAAGRSGARLVVLDNVYMLGRPQGKPLDEDTPLRPCSRKGEVRARVAERMWEAHRRGDVRATSGRASDFYGPGGTLTHLGDQFWRPAIAGKRGRVLVDPDAIPRITTFRTSRRGWRRSAWRGTMRTGGCGCCRARPPKRCRRWWRGFPTISDRTPGGARATTACIVWAGAHGSIHSLPYAS